MIPPLRCLAAIVALGLAGLTPASAGEAHATDAGAGPELLVVEPMLDGQRLAEILHAYESGGDILLPVGDLARLLAIAVTVDPSLRMAAGFVITEDRRFRIDAEARLVTVDGRRHGIAPGTIRWIDGEMYVPARRLQEWWPVDFHLDMASLTLKARPREPLPIQARLARERAGAGLVRARQGREPGLAVAGADYALLGAPFMDNTVAFEVRGTDRGTTANGIYTGYLTADLLGMEAAAWLSISRREPDPKARLALARHDPDAGLLGPLGARSVMFGSIALPALENTLRGSGYGEGVLVSNRPLSQPGSYGLHTLRGELPPGWDVTLYFNDALIGFQQSREDGLYEFPDQPLVYGRNEFRLVFNGPLGQSRTEREVFQLDQTLTAPGRFHYTAAGQRADHGTRRSTLQFDVGLAGNLALNAGAAHVGGSGAAAGDYASIGLRSALLGALFNADHVRRNDGGHLNEVRARTMLFGVSIDATQAWLHDFSSEIFRAGGDPVKARSRIRLAASIPVAGRRRLPVALDFRREVRESGEELLALQQRLSVNVRSTSFTNMLDWRGHAGPDRLDGLLQVSRRVAGVGFSGQGAYVLAPEAKLLSLAASANRSIGPATRLSAGVLRDFALRRTTLTAGLTRDFGTFGIGLSAMHGGGRNRALGLQLFTAMGRDPRSGRVVRDWRPMAGSGLVSALVFVDGNRNGIHDDGETLVENAGFTINGGRRPIRTDASGVALIRGLTPGTYADIALDHGTLEDAQWQTAAPGMRVLPRPGKVRTLDFPVVVTGEIDGTVFLVGAGGSRGIGNALVELLDETGAVARSARSASDGFYVLDGVPPGKYRLRVSAEQLQRLGLTLDGEPEVTMTPEGDFVSGIDLKLGARR